MTNRKTTKRALWSSVLSLLLCFAMLLGTTYAWFTDSVTSANNIIKSGNLDITLEYLDGENNWSDVEGSSEILDKNALWEPGYTKVVYLRVKNAGSLALKYLLGVNIVSETAGVNVDGDYFLLSDYIYYDVKVMNGEEFALFADRDAAMEIATETKLISAGYTNAGTLEAGSDYVYVAMVVYMPTTVGNVANYKTGTNAPQIDLGINIFATQYTSEKDSFDEYYDGGAKWLGDIDISWYDANATEFVIGNPEQLAGLAQIVNSGTDSFVGKTIKLASDIDLYNKNWTPIGSFDYDRDAQAYANVVTFKGTFDGQGHTINNLKIDAPTTDGAALFGCVEAATIKNVNVHNVDIVASSHAAAILARGYQYSKTTTVENCHVTGNINIQIDWAYAAGVVAKATGLNISDCSVMPTDTGVITAANRNAVGGIVGWVETVGASTISNCQVANMDLTGWANIGSINGYVQAGCKIDNCSAENIVLTKTRADGHPTIGLVAGGFSYNANQPVTITNNAVKNITLNGTHIAAPASANILYGAEFSGNANSNFVLDNNTPENVTNKLIEVTKITDGIVEDANGTKTIYNANGLKSLSGQKISGKYVLAADIDLGGAEFKAMSAWYNTATFNGNGYTISNAKVVSGDNDNGTEQSSLFFVSTNGSLTVSDLTIKDITVTTKNIDNGYAAAVVGYCEGVLVLNNVDVVNADITGSKSSGMLVGHLTPAGSLTATDCNVDGSITISSFETSGHYAGEYVGTIAGNTALVDCTAVVTLGGNLKSTNVGTIYGRKVSGVLTVDGAIPVATTEALIDAIKNAPVGEVTTIALTSSVYAGDIKITLEALGKQGGDVVIKAAKGVNPVITGMVTLGYRNQGTGSAMYNANVTFDGITFKQATADTHSINVEDVKSLTLVHCTIINNGEYGIASARGNATGASKIEACTFENAGMQLLGNYATGLVIDNCIFNDSRINVQAGNGVTIQNCEFNSTLTDANVGDSFYMIRSNSTPITVKDCEINVDSTVTGVAANQAKWYLMANRGTTNWTVENVTVTMTDAALAQTSLVVTACTSTGVINVTNLTVNGNQQ